MVWWLYELMPEAEARDFMMQTVDPDPMIDRETGLELGDECELHLGNRLTGAVILSPGFRMECDLCAKLFLAESK
jgi:hypothetical protein